MDAKPQTLSSCEALLIGLDVITPVKLLVMNLLCLADRRHEHSLDGVSFLKSASMRVAFSSPLVDKADTVDRALLELSANKYSLVLIRTDEPHHYYQSQCADLLTAKLAILIPGDFLLRKWCVTIP